MQTSPVLLAARHAYHAHALRRQHQSAPRFDIVRVDIQEVAIGVLKTETVAVFVIDGVDKRHNSSLILWTGGT